MKTDMSYQGFFSEVKSPGPWPDPPKIVINKAGEMLAANNNRNLSSITNYYKTISKEKDGIIIIQPQGSIDTEQKLLELSNNLCSAVEHGYTKIIIDLSQAEYLVLETIRILKETKEKYTGILAICAPNESFKELFKITELDKELSIYPNLSEAENALTP